MADFMETRTWLETRLGVGGLVLAVILGSAGSVDGQTIPGLPAAPSPAPAKDAAKQEVAAPTKDNPQATVAESTSTIDVNKPVNEFKVQDFLEETLVKYPGVYEIHADVDGSVVTLTGHVENEAVRDRLGQVALKVEGVVFVANNLKTDAQILSAPELLSKQLHQFIEAVGHNWLLFLLAVAVFIGSLMAAKVFAKYSETLLAPLTANVLLRSVLGSILSAAIIAGGFLAAFQVFGMAAAVTSMLGLAGVVALAIGFAFRDITENFIASILLSTRRPFNVGDYVEVAGRAGVVKALNTRATVLLTLEGKTIRIPNAMVFKEIVSNASAASSSRSTFDILIPYDVSTVQAMDLIGTALSDHEAILNDPPPRALVDELTPAGVKLRVYFWMPTKNVDGFKVNSDAKLKAKVALQQAGIRPPATMFKMETADRAAADSTARASNGEGRRPVSGDNTPVVSASQARANLAHDSRAANAAADVTPTDDVMRHVQNMSGGDVVSEGTNLIAKDVKPKEPPNVKDTNGDGNEQSNGESKPEPVQSA
jgi:small-conductance mechanosensitive channel